MPASLIDQIETRHGLTLEFFLTARAWLSVTLAMSMLVRLLLPNPKASVYHAKMLAIQQDAAPDQATRPSLGSGTRTLVSSSRSASPEPDASPINVNTQSNSDEKSRSKTFIRKTFTASWGRKRSDVYAEDGARGRLGLRLLHPSPEPLVDLIFVHGLRGGSTKTWRKGSDSRLFWPQFWLPTEPELRHVSIHSFGYDSDWASSQASVLNIHDFGQSFLEEMRNSPHLKDHTNVSIFFKTTPRAAIARLRTYLLRDQ